MPTQHIIAEEVSQEQGIIVPLELAGLRILRQELQADGTLQVEVIGTTDRVSCPHCGAVCVKQHDVRKRRKRDVPLRGHQVELVLHKRRFWCFRCRKACTESDSACGRRKRTTVRLREVIGKQADVTGLLERLSDCDAVEAVSMDMSETFRAAVQLCEPLAGSWPITSMWCSMWAKRSTKC